jgi:hypothetical protein
LADNDGNIWYKLTFSFLRMGFKSIEDLIQHEKDARNLQMKKRLKELEAKLKSSAKPDDSTKGRELASVKSQSPQSKSQFLSGTKVTSPKKNSSPSKFVNMFINVYNCNRLWIKLSNLTSY